MQKHDNFDASPPVYNDGVADSKYDSADQPMQVNKEKVGESASAEGGEQNNHQSAMPFVYQFPNGIAPPYYSYAQPYQQLFDVKSQPNATFAWIAPPPDAPVTIEGSWCCKHSRSLTEYEIQKYAGQYGNLCFFKIALITLVLIIILFGYSSISCVKRIGHQHHLMPLWNLWPLVTAAGFCISMASFCQTWKRHALIKECFNVQQRRLESKQQMTEVVNSA